MYGDTVYPVTYQSAIEYLTRCVSDDGNHYHSGRAVDAADCPTCKGSNDAGYLGTPGSRYGSTTARCAPTAYELARIWAREDSDVITYERLDYAMSLVVNDSETPERDIEQYRIAQATGADDPHQGGQAMNALERVAIGIAARDGFDWNRMSEASRRDYLQLARTQVTE
jgi:hypothetical protein